MANLLMVIFIFIAVPAIIMDVKLKHFFLIFDFTTSKRSIFENLPERWVFILVDLHSIQVEYLMWICPPFNLRIHRHLV